jgi:hypothetical protein
VVRAVAVASSSQSGTAPHLAVIEIITPIRHAYSVPRTEPKRMKPATAIARASCGIFTPTKLAQENKNMAPE